MTNLPALQDNEVQALVALADRIKSADGLIPKAYVGNPGKILAAMLIGRELGVGAMTALRAFYVVEGRPVASAEFWVARLRAQGYRLEWLHKADDKCTLVLVDPQGNKSAPETWDRKRAETAGLWGRNTWARHPQAMLTARCVTSAARAFAAEVMFGGMLPDEAEEIQEVEARVVDAPKSGMAALAHKIAPPAAAEKPAIPESVAAVAAAVGSTDVGPAPFDLEEEARAAILSADSEGRLALIAKRLTVSKFSKAEMAGLRATYREHLDTLREAESAAAGVDDNPVGDA